LVVDAPSLTPALEGRFIKLRPVVFSDSEFLYSLMTSNDLLIRGRLGGSSLRPDGFGDFLWNGVLVQFLAVAERGPVGLVSVYNADHLHQFAYLASYFRPDAWSKGWPFEAIALIVRHTFNCWPFRKLLLEMLSYNYERVASGVGRVFEIEAHMRNHRFVGGSYYDEYTLALWRDQGLRFCERVLESGE
jgi:RimJ/RimL family protein N-acetyltransferase